MLYCSLLHTQTAIGNQQISDYDTLCGSQGSISSQFVTQEFYGLFLMCGSMFIIAVLLKIIEVLRYLREVRGSSSGSPAGKGNKGGSRVIEVKPSTEHPGENHDEDQLERIIKAAVQYSMKELAKNK
jgi:hypothetical protein